jgi:acylglycerol lipase
MGTLRHAIFGAARACVLAGAIGLTACATALQFAPFTPRAAAGAQFETAAFISYDGARLPGEHWRADADEPAVVVLALHGINSSARAFDPLATWLSRRGVETYAFDGRGFGRSPFRGAWVGQAVMAADARAALLALRKRHPETPIAVLGGSLGAAQAIVAFADPDAPQPDRLILVSPGVMGWDHLPFGMAPLLRTGALLTPWMTLAPTPEMERNQPATNNPAAREYQQRDPLRIQQTRIDVLAGAMDLMEKANSAIARLQAPTAFLYGAKDHVIDQRALREAAARLPAGSHVAMYPEGHHLLLRDLEAEAVYADILSFLTAPGAVLASGRAADGFHEKQR